MSWSRWLARSKACRASRRSAWHRPSWSSWLEGLFHGIQAAMWAQYMQAQFEAMRRRTLPQGIPQLQADKGKEAEAEPKEGGDI